MSVEMQQILASMWEQRRTAGDGPEPTLEELRAFIDAVGNVYRVPEDVVVTEVQADNVPGVWLAPPGVGDGVVLYLHGGGYQLGSSVSHRELASRIARAAGARALVIDYRLAPEAPFPAAVEDAIGAYRWLLAQGTPAAAIALAGDSAGGGLTAALLVALRDAEVEQPAAAVMLSPWLDLTGTGDSMTARSEIDPVLTPERLAEMAAMYLGDVDPRHPYASPLYADLSGLVPPLVQVGTEEVLLDDAVRFADQARAAGVPVALEVVEGMPHVWQIVSGAPESMAATDRIGAFISDRLA